MLSIATKARFENEITRYEWHAHAPYNRNYDNNDEIVIAISQQDVITAPFESILHVTGTLTGKKQDGTAADVKFVNNPVAHLFESANYRISGKNIDYVRTIGVATTMKGLVSIQGSELTSLQHAGWVTPGTSFSGSEFSFCVPLRLLMGFAEDYKKIITGGRHELILLRAPTDDNAVISADAASITLTLTNVWWRVPHITLGEEESANLLEMTRIGTKVEIPFRQWGLYELPALPTTKTHSWTIKTSSQLEKPRYVVVGFQTDRKNKLNKDMSCFDACDIQEVRLFLNSTYFPYENIRGDMSVFYEMFAHFQKAYYGKTTDPCVSFPNFKNKTPLYVIDCSHQEDSLKTGPIDVRLDIMANSNFPANTTAYCLIMNDQNYLYDLMTSSLTSAL